MLKKLKVLLIIFVIASLKLSASSQDISYFVQELSNDAYQIDAYLKIKAPETLLWKTISEYDKTEDFVKSINSSTIISRNKNRVVLDLKCGNIFIRVHMVLDMREFEVFEGNQKIHRIEYEEISQEDFIFFKGFWEVRKDGDTGIIHLSINTKPKRSYFGMTMRIIDHSIKALFRDIKVRVASIQTAEAEAKSDVDAGIRVHIQTPINTEVETQINSDTQTQIKSEFKPAVETKIKDNPKKEVKKKLNKKMLNKTKKLKNKSHISTKSK